MTREDGLSRRLSKAIFAHDFLRYPFPGTARPGWQKEWLHFCVLNPEIELLVNLNISGDTRPAAAPGTRAARMVLLAHTGEWHGDIETIDARAVTAIPGEVGMTLGQNFVRFREDRFELVAALQSQSLVVDLRLQPETVPLAMDGEVPVARGSIGWFVLPRLTASGRVIAGRRVFELNETPAYHDHNWGHWLWGDDFCWEWGFTHFASGAEIWTAVFDRTLNRARTRLLEATLALWRDAELVKIFSRKEITVRPLAYSAPKTLLRIPKPLALAVPQLGRDVPRHFHVNAASGSDRVSLLLRTENEAQVLVPNETDLETTIITEVTGQVAIEGSIKDMHISGSGKGLFEFLTI